MDIATKTYTAMTPAVRARAYLAALGRQDEAEAERLLVTAPSGQGYERAISQLDHVVMAYPIMVFAAASDFAILLCRLGMAAGYRDGWRAAGGQTYSLELLKNIKLIEQLAPETEKKKQAFNAVCQAASEWCEREGIDPADLARPFGLKAPAKDSGQVDEEALESYRKVFEGIRLSL